MKKEDRNILSENLFNSLFQEHYTHLCNFSYQFTLDTEASKDVVQKVYIDLWNKRAQYDPNKSIKSYLFTSVRNRSLNYIRDQKKLTSLSLEHIYEDSLIVTEEEDIDQENLSKIVNQALDSLSDKVKEVFLMSRYQGMKYKEIAEELDVSQKTVEAHISKAMKILRTFVKDNELYLILIFTLFVLG